MPLEIFGIEVAQSTRGISPCQHKYCMNLVNNSSLLEFNPTSTLSNPSIKLNQDKNATYVDILIYKNLIIKLVYLITTRSNITYID